MCISWSWMLRFDVCLCDSLLYVLLAIPPSVSTVVDEGTFMEQRILLLRGGTADALRAAAATLSRPRPPLADGGVRWVTRRVVSIGTPHHHVPPTRRRFARCDHCDRRSTIGGRIHTSLLHCGTHTFKKWTPPIATSSSSLHSPKTFLVVVFFGSPSLVFSRAACEQSFFGMRQSSRH